MEFSRKDYTAPENPRASQTRAQFGQVTATHDAEDTAQGAALRSTKRNRASPSDDPLMSILTCFKSVTYNLFLHFKGYPAKGQRTGACSSVALGGLFGFLPPHVTRSNGVSQYIISLVSLGRLISDSLIGRIDPELHIRTILTPRRGRP